MYFFLPVAADIISCVEFNHDGDLLATGDKGGRVVIFQRDPIVSRIPNEYSTNETHSRLTPCNCMLMSRASSYSERLAR